MSALRHHSRTEDVLRNVLGVVVDSLLVVLHNVVLAFITLTTLENITSLEVGHRRTAITITKVCLLLPLVLHLGSERSSHVGMVLGLSLRSVEAVFSSKRIKSFVQKRSVVLTLRQETAVGFGTTSRAIVGIKGLIGVLNDFDYVLAVSGLTLVSHRVRVA